MFKNLLALFVVCLTFSAIFSVEPEIPTSQEDIQTVEIYRFANVLFSDGSLHEIEMARPMFMSNSCQRSTTQAQVGEMWMGKDGRSYVYDGNNVWSPRRKDQEPPVTIKSSASETDDFDEDKGSILDRVVIEEYSVPVTTNEGCATCGNTRYINISGNYATFTGSNGYTYTRGSVFRRRPALFPRLRNMFSRMRFRFRRW